MMRWQLFVGFALIVAILVSRTEAGEPKYVKSDSKVKATATASAPDADGKQVVTITLDIAKGWWLIANPANHKEEVFALEQVKVKFATKEKVKADVRYPAGKTRRSGPDKFDIYEGGVKIQADVMRVKGDSSTLQITIYVRAFDDSICLQPATIKLTVK